MELGYPGTNSENEFGLQEYDGSTSDANLDLNHEVKKGGEVNGPENEVWDDRTQMEVDQLAHHRSSLLHADVEHEGPKSPYEQTNSQEDYRFRHDEKIQEFDFDNERTYSYIGETEMGSGRYFDKLDSPVEGGLHNELEVGNLAKADVDSGADYMEQQNNMKERSPHHEEDAYSGKELDNVQNGRTEYLHKPEIESTEHLGSVFYDDKRTEEGDINNSGKSPSDNEKLVGTWNDIHPTGTTRQRSSSPLREMSPSPVRGNEIQRDADGKLPLSPQGRDFSYSSPRMPTEKFSPSFERHHHRESSSSPLREMSRSPVRANEIRGASQKLPLSPGGQDFSYSPRRMSGQKFSPSPERHGGNSKRDLSQDHPSLSARRISASPGGRSRRDSPRRDSSVMKSTSPRRRYLSPGRRRNERSVSRSPTRRRDLSSGYRRDYRDRSRSRSPSAAGRYRRSPRRYSPRRRSPPPGYHSRRRSPRRKPWSPPRNRNNGIGRPGNNLFVAGFSFVTTERDLERKFSRFGRVRDVRIVRDKRSGDSRGFGFLSLERDEDADEAIRALDQTEWNGRVVLVEKSKTR